MKVTPPYLALSIKIMIAVQMAMGPLRLVHASESDFSIAASPVTHEKPLAYPKVVALEDLEGHELSAIQYTTSLHDGTQNLTVEITLPQPQDKKEQLTLANWMKIQRQFHNLEPTIFSIEPGQPEPYEQLRQLENQMSPYGEIEKIKIPLRVWEKIQFWAYEKSQKIKARIEIMEARHETRVHLAEKKQSARKDQLVRFLKDHPESATWGLALVRTVGVGAANYWAFTLAHSGEMATLINSIALGIISGGFILKADDYKSFIGQHQHITRGLSKVASWLGASREKARASLNQNRRYDLSLQAIKYTLTSASLFVLAHTIFALTGEPLYPNLESTLTAITVASFFSYLGQGVLENAFTTENREEKNHIDKQLAGLSPSPKAEKEIQHLKDMSDFAVKFKFLILALVANFGSALTNTNPAEGELSTNILGYILMGTLGLAGISHFSHVLYEYDENFRKRVQPTLNSVQKKISKFKSAACYALLKTVHTF